MYYKASVGWLEAAEGRLANLSTISDNVRAVRIQLEQLKVTHLNVIALLVVIAAVIMNANIKVHSFIHFWHAPL